MIRIYIKFYIKKNKKLIQLNTKQDYLHKSIIVTRIIALILFLVKQISCLVSLPSSNLRGTYTKSSDSPWPCLAFDFASLWSLAMFFGI